MPSIPWWLAPCALTVSMSPNSHSNRSRSWIECSISTPEPARERSPRQVEAYIPWVGRYWSSRSTTCMTGPSAPSTSRWRRATSAGVERRTSPTWLTQPGPLDQLRDAPGLVEVTAEGLLAQHRHARLGRSADPFEMRSGPGRDHERIAGGRDRVRRSRAPRRPCSAANARARSGSASCTATIRFGSSANASCSA